MFGVVGLDGSTSGLERERLINRFNSAGNSEVHLFLLSTRYVSSVVSCVDLIVL